MKAIPELEVMYLRLPSCLLAEPEGGTFYVLGVQRNPWDREIPASVCHAAIRLE